MNLLLSLLLLFSYSTVCGHQITIVGCGYVGLTLARVLLHKENQIICLDVDSKKIVQLTNKCLPIYEPQLQDQLFNNQYSNNLSFTDDIKQAMDSEIYYICVPTPQDPHGDCDRSFLDDAFKNVVTNCSTTDPKIICIKSTVPPGTLKELQDYLTQEKKFNIHLFYNPEFMREGTALQDIAINPIIIGGEPGDAMQKIEGIYTTLLHAKNKIIKTDFETAEMIKYAWNSFSALRINFINELASICMLYNSDIATIIQGLALSEELMPTSSLKPGPGYGGSCLPKDVTIFSKIAEQKGLSQLIIQHLPQANTNHRKRILEFILEALDLTGNPQIITLLGLSFKAGTDDIRNSFAIDIIQTLMNHKVTIKAYDPQAIPNMRALFPSVEYFDSPYDAIKNSDCIVILTEWDEIKELDFDKVALLCNKKIIIDTRNLYSATKLKKYDFSFINMGLKN